MIGIVTLNRDTFTNPTLYGIIAQLNKQGIPVTLFCNNRDSNIPAELNLTAYADAPNGLIWPRRPKNLYRYLRVFWQMLKAISKNKITQLIAVDPAGLVLAGRIWKFKRQLAIHYCSFEIFFEKEIAHDPALVSLKKQEIKYSKIISSVLVQDVFRQQLLIQENHIPANMSNWHFIPVSPMLPNQIASAYTRASFGLKESDVVYIHSGSVADWSGIKHIIEAAKKGLPDNHYLFIHNKFKFDENNPTVRELRELQANGAHIRLHDVFFENYEEYCGFLNCFDYGIVIYEPDNGTHTGMNIKEIGLSSGKFSSFLSQGLPLILSPCRSYRDILSRYPIGTLLSEEQDLAFHIQHHSLAKIDRQVCKDFFKAVLDPREPIAQFLTMLTANR